MKKDVCVVDGLSFRYKKRSIFGKNAISSKGIEDISLVLKEGEICGIVGESGSGKSTLAKCIAGLLTPAGGTVETGKVGMIFQDSFSALNPGKTVGWLLQESLFLRGTRDKQVQKEKIDRIMEEVELEAELLDRKPAALSGGQRQRVMIAMALLAEPEVLIADEPVSALDVTIQKQILALLKKLCTRRNLSILFISHDLRTVFLLCDSCAVMKDGKMVEYGATRELYCNPKTEYTKLLLESAGL